MTWILYVILINKMIWITCITIGVSTVKPSLKTSYVHYRSLMNWLLFIMIILIFILKCNVVNKCLDFVCFLHVSPEERINIRDKNYCKPLAAPYWTDSPPLEADALTVPWCYYIFTYELYSSFYELIFPILFGGFCAWGFTRNLMKCWWR